MTMNARHDGGLNLSVGDVQEIQDKLNEISTAAFRISCTVNLHTHVYIDGTTTMSMIINYYDTDTESTKLYRYYDYFKDESDIQGFVDLVDDGKVGEWFFTQVMENLQHDD
jgi:hypothetical protein